MTNNSGSKIDHFYLMKNLKTSHTFKNHNFKIFLWPKDGQRIGLIGRKIGVTNFWEKDTGYKRTCTLIQIPENHVIRYFPKDEFDGQHAAAIVGAGNVLPTMKNEIYNQWCRDAGVPIKSKCFRFLCSESAALLPGTKLSINHFRPGDFINLRIKSIGYGHLDAMQRWHMGGGPAYDRGGFKRGTGAIAPEGDDRVVRGKKMPGKVGNVYEKILGRKILKINYKYNVMWINGRISGHVNQHVAINDHMHLGRKRNPLQRKEKFNIEPPPFPTCFEEIDERYGGEAFCDEYFQWGSEIIDFKK